MCYSSLFSYCTEALGYSEGAAFRRISAARALNDNPEIYELLQTGKLSLCAVAEIAKVIRPENKLEVLESSIGRPKAEVQRITAKYQVAKAPLKHERVAAVTVYTEAGSRLALLK